MCSGDLTTTMPLKSSAARDLVPYNNSTLGSPSPMMWSLVDSAKLVVSVLVSSTLQFVSRTIRIRPAIHRLVKVFDRGHAKVCDCQLEDCCVSFSTVRLRVETVLRASVGLMCRSLLEVFLPCWLVCTRRPISLNMNCCAA